VLYDIVDELDKVAAESGLSVPQVAINWLLTRPTVSSVIIGARDPGQLEQNLAAVQRSLDPDQVSRLEDVSAKTAPYPHFPYYQQEAFARLNPPLAG
jgi:aryl-alcohol dehydrogenase-like predicted oxidoreductase